MIKNKKKFICVFLITFAATVLLTVFMIFVVLRGMFYNIYKSKGNKAFDAGNYTEAIDNYYTAKYWKGKKQEIYLLLAKAYAGKDDYGKAGELIDEAIDERITTDDTGLLQLYTMRIQLLSASGEISDAVTYTDGIDDQYILKKIQSTRPGDISYTPNQGNYDKTLKMSITVREGETVYYTTDGTYPNKFSTVYVDPINIGTGTTQVCAVAVNEEGLVSPMLNVSYTVTNDNEAVEFDDAKIEKMVRRALSKSTGIVRVKELQSITELSNDGIEGYVTTLSDFDLMPNIESLYLDGESQLTSISQLSGKSKLKHLSLVNCSLDTSDINVLGSLTSLETLDISNNMISSIDVLANVTTLKFVYLSHNMIEDITPLAANEGVEFIDASFNRLTAVPDFNKAPALTTLILGNNMISDISTVHRFEALTYLDLSHNYITNAKNIKDLKNLDTLDISNNTITNFDFIAHLTKLTLLDISSTSFVNTKMLAGLNLNVLCANDTGITSLSDIGQISSLVSLEIASTGVTDITPLTTLEYLDYLDISYCNIENTKPLESIKNLYTLKASGVDITEIKFSNKGMVIIE